LGENYRGLVAPTWWHISSSGHVEHLGGEKGASIFSALQRVKKMNSPFLSGSRGKSRSARSIVREWSRRWFALPRRRAGDLSERLLLVPLHLLEQSDQDRETFTVRLR
jgi:hypothetical protein